MPRSAGFDTGECGMKAVGGVVTFEGGFTVHTFTRNDTFAVLRDDLISVEVLAVGGGARRRRRRQRGGRRRRRRGRRRRRRLQPHRLER